MILPRTHWLLAPARTAYGILLKFGNVAWVCRISIASVLLGCVIFGAIPQTQDLFAETRTPWWYWPLFFMLAFFGWAVPVHFAARRLLASDYVRAKFVERAGARRVDILHASRAYRLLVAWFPRLLGLGCFYAIDLGIRGARDNFLGASFREAGDLLPGLEFLRKINLAVALLFLIVTVLRSFLMRKLRIDQTVADVATSRTYLILMSGLVLLLCLDPAANVPFLPRAALLILTLGAPVLLLSFLTGCSYRYRFPCVFTAFLFLGVLSSYFNDNGIRTLRLPPGSATQVALEKAIVRWKEANGCAEKASCPRPIIIAGQGGASRAAFFTASVIGKLLDLQARAEGPFDDFGSRLFAFATASGSSLGAIMVRTAISDSKSLGLYPKPPCRRADRLWFGESGANDGEVSRSWQACLEAIIAGDFLSPVAVGLALRDNIPFLADRAAVLEWSWERRYQAIVGSDSLRQAFGHLDAPWARGAADWIPMLFLNGTSLVTGRRVVISEALPWRCVGGGSTGGGWQESLFPEALDLFDLLGRRDADAGTEQGCATAERPPSNANRSDDIRLSTAAALSARFPVISPPGAIWREGERRGPIDYVVDGGYFDNDGLLTARDLASALKSAGLSPVILHLRNEPLKVSTKYGRTPARSDDSEPQLSYSPPLPRRPVPRYVFALSVPIIGLASVRGARFFDTERAAIAAAEYLEISTWYDQPQAESVGLFEPSMSWWLSQSVQAYLHRQVDNEHNTATMEYLAAELRK